MPEDWVHRVYRIETNKKLELLIIRNYEERMLTELQAIPSKIPSIHHFDPNDINISIPKYIYVAPNEKWLESITSLETIMKICQQSLVMTIEFKCIRKYLQFWFGCFL